MSVFIYDDVVAKGFFKGIYNTDIFADSPLEDHGREDFLSLSYVVQVVNRNSLA